MTNANALPIQERLRDSPHALRLTREAADRIDDLEKALRDVLGRHQVTHCHAAALAALGEGE